MPTRPSDNYWQDGTSPYLYPGLNDRENAVKDYSEALAAEASLATVSTSRALAIGDKGKTIRAESASTITFTVPNDSSVNFAVGSSIQFFRYGAGAVAFTPASGVTLNPTSPRSIRAQWSAGVLVKMAANEWLLTGDLG